MWCWLPLVLLGLPIAPVNAASSVVLEKTEGLPPGWVFRSNAEAFETIAVSVVLKEPGIEALKTKLFRRSGDPDHPDFGGRHLSREEIQQHRKPDAKVVNSVTSWLKSSGVRDVRVEGSFVNFVASVRTVKSLFQADLAHYSHGKDGKPFLRALNYTVPALLRQNIDFVYPLTNFITPRGGHNKHAPKLGKSKIAKGKPANVKPACPKPTKPTKPTEPTKPAEPSTLAKSTKSKSTKSTVPPKSSLSSLQTLSLTSVSSEAPTLSSSPETSFSSEASTVSQTSLSSLKSLSSSSSESTLSLTFAPSATPVSSTSTGWPILTLNPDDDWWNDNHTQEDQEPDYPCLTGAYPECIRKLYNITYNETAPSPARFGVAGFLEQWIHHKDVIEFVNTLAPEIKDLDPPHNYTVELFHGGTNPQPEYISSGIEAALDVEYALALGYPSEVTYYVTGGRGAKLDRNGTALPESQSDNEPYLEFLESLLAKPDDELPHVLSVSYADDEIGIPLLYARKVCDLFAAVSARGVSIFTATGDGGAAGTGQTQCTSNDGFHRKMYIPTFPASCPFVTSVGAVSNIAPPLSGADFSSGGFSNYFARPDWQRAVVDPYVDNMVKNNDERLPLFNWTGRAMPDISAIGSAFQVYQSGNLGQVLGTSASTPVIAAMVALVNDKRLRAGKPSLGWINPLLYSPKVREVLRDVTVGRSNGCWFPDNTRAVGWRSVKGYDCVTGLGTVDDFNDFLAVLS